MSRLRKANQPVSAQQRGDGQDHREGRRVEVLGRHQREVLERREVPQPVGELQHLGQHEHDHGEPQAEPAERGQPRPDAVEQPGRARTAPAPPGSQASVCQVSRSTASAVAGDQGVADAQPEPGRRQHQRRCRPPSPPTWPSSHRRARGRRSRAPPRPGRRPPRRAGAAPRRSRSPTSSSASISIDDRLEARRPGRRRRPQHLLRGRSLSPIRSPAPSPIEPYASPVSSQAQRPADHRAALQPPGQPDRASPGCGTPRGRARAGRPAPRSRCRAARSTAYAATTATSASASEQQGRPPAQAGEGVHPLVPADRARATTAPRCRRRRRPAARTPRRSPPRSSAVHRPGGGR